MHRILGDVYTYFLEDLCIIIGTASHIYLTKILIMMMQILKRMPREKHNL